MINNIDKLPIVMGNKINDKTGDLVFRMKLLLIDRQELQRLLKIESEYKRLGGIVNEQ